MNFCSEEEGRDNAVRQIIGVDRVGHVRQDSIRRGTPTVGRNFICRTVFTLIVESGDSSRQNVSGWNTSHDRTKQPGPHLSLVKNFVLLFPFSPSKCQGISTVADERKFKHERFENLIILEKSVVFDESSEQIRRYKIILPRYNVVDVMSMNIVFRIMYSGTSDCRLQIVVGEKYAIRTLPNYRTTLNLPLSAIVRSDTRQWFCALIFGRKTTSVRVRTNTCHDQTRTRPRLSLIKNLIFLFSSLLPIFATDPIQGHETMVLRANIWKEDDLRAWTKSYHAPLIATL